MGIIIWEWKIEDKTALAENLNNIDVLNNLRDGLPYPYNEDDAEDIKHHIDVKVDMDELDLTNAEAKVTYKEIQN